MSSIARGVQKLFVGNLPWQVGTGDLKQYFSKFGHVKTCLVLFDRNSGISRGYGFVTFSTPEGFEAATGSKNHRLEGRVLTVEPASS